MATAHIAIAATISASTQIAAASTNRRALFIQNYAESGGTIYVAFGQAATAGSAGEIEIPPGQNFSWGGRLAFPSNPPAVGAPPAPACPAESINVISLNGSASGCAVTQ